MVVCTIIGEIYMSYATLRKNREESLVMYKETSIFAYE